MTSSIKVHQAYHIGILVSLHVLGGPSAHKGCIDGRADGS